MKKVLSFITTLFALSLAIMLTGCIGTATPVVHYKSVLVSPPNYLILDCLVEPPPNKEEYMAATGKKREEMLGEVLSKQTKNTHLCNERLAKLRKWKADQEALYHLTKPKEE